MLRKAGPERVAFSDKSFKKKKKKKKKKSFQIVLPFKVLRKNKRTEKKEDRNHRRK